MIELKELDKFVLYACWIVSLMKEEELANYYGVSVPELRKSVMEVVKWEPEKKTQAKELILARLRDHRWSKEVNSDGGKNSVQPEV